MSFKIVVENQATLIEWAETHLTGSKFRDDAQAIGNERHGELCAVVLFDTFTTTSCLVHVVSDGSKKWLTREFIRAVFAYPFLQCGYPRISAIVAESNTEALKLDLHLGWVVEGRLREDAEDGGDNILLGMLRRECRYVPAGFRVVRNVEPSKSV